MKTSDKIKHLREILGVLNSTRLGLCACMVRVLPVMGRREYTEFKKYVLALHARGLNRYGYLKGIPYPYTDRGHAYRKNLLRKAIATVEAELEAPKKKPKRATKKKAAK